MDEHERRLKANREADFNARAGREFAAEYALETTRVVTFRPVDKDFPDAELVTDDERTLGVELVSVVLAFLHQEESDLAKYRPRLLEAFGHERPRYAGFRIQLQPSFSQFRPFRLPAVHSAEGKRLIAELSATVSKACERLPNGGGVLITELWSNDFRDCEVVLRYFTAILISRTREAMDDQPIIAPHVQGYSVSEIADAVVASLKAKHTKGRSYATDILVLHTLETRGKPYSPGLPLSAEEILEAARVALEQLSELADRFGEIWFFNAYASPHSGKRLFRVK